jgi:hypothetical protein
MDGGVVVQMKRVMVLSVLALSTLGLTACSSGSSAPTPKAPPGVAVLGVTTATWQSGHAANAGGYGSSVTINGKSMPQFTSIKESGGRVVGWHMTFPAHTKLPAAEALVRAQLPKDARQTASGRNDFAQAATYCEFVNYQSATLAGSLGTPVPTGAQGNVGVVLYEITPQHSGSSSIASVNAADVSTTPVTAGQPC